MRRPKGRRGEERRGRRPTFYVEVARRLAVVRLTRVLAGVLHADAVDIQPEDAALVVEVVLVSVEYLQLALVPAQARITLGKLTLQRDDDVLLATIHVLQLLDPVLLQLQGKHAG